MLNTLVRP